MNPEDFKNKKDTEKEEKPKAEAEKPEAEEEKPKPEQERRKPELEKLKAEAEEADLEEEEAKVDPVEAKKAKDVIQSFKKTFSLIKLYPPENPSAQKSIDLFYTQIGEFLNEYEELIIEIGEFSFSYNKELVFQDIEKRKSLPFLFYRDGVRELSFYKDLDKEELQDFFETIREVSDLPPEDTDIVNSIWEKDFVHIRYFSIDEFLDQDIGEPTEEISLVDKLGLSKGDLKLTPKDQELYKKGLGLGIEDGREKGEGEFEGEPGDETTVATRVQAVKKEEMPEIESMLVESRKTSPVNELVALLFELLFFEEREEEFSEVVNVLDKCHQNVVDGADFASALSILSQLKELKKTISSKSEERAKKLNIILSAAKEPIFISHLKKLYSDGHVEDFDAFFEYLGHLGPSAFPVVAKIWEESKFPFSRTKVANFLKEIGKKDIDSLLNLAKEQAPSLAREILSIVADASEKKKISHLEDFVNNPSKDIRLEVIQVLGKYEDEAANKILLKFLSDQDVEVRARAFMNLKYLGDKAPFDYALRLAQEKDFRDRIKLEKKAILNFLASTETEEIVTLLRSMLKKRRIFSRHKNTETRLCAVSALERMATPEAVNVLDEGAKLRNRTIRKACKRALRNITRKQKSKEIAKDEKEG
jgi:HEAT repeat protein